MLIIFHFQEFTLDFKISFVRMFLDCYKYYSKMSKASQLRSEVDQCGKLDHHRSNIRFLSNTSVNELPLFVLLFSSKSLSALPQTKHITKNNTLNRYFNRKSTGGKTHFHKHLMFNTTKMKEWLLLNEFFNIIKLRGIPNLQRTCYYKFEIHFQQKSSSSLNCMCNQFRLITVQRQSIDAPNAQLICLQWKILLFLRIFLLVLSVLCIDIALQYIIISFMLQLMITKRIFYVIAISWNQHFLYKLSSLTLNQQLHKQSQILHTQHLNSNISANKIIFIATENRFGKLIDSTRLDEKNRNLLKKIQYETSKYEHLKEMDLNVNWKRKLLLQYSLKTKPIGIPIKSVIVVRMVQIVVTNDKNIQIPASPSSNQSNSQPTEIQSTTIATQLSNLNESRCDEIDEYTNTDVRDQSTFSITTPSLAGVVAETNNLSETLNTNTSIQLNVTNKDSIENMNTINQLNNSSIVTSDNNVSLLPNLISLPVTTKIRMSNDLSKKSNVIMVKNSKSKDKLNGTISQPIRSINISKSKACDNHNSTVASVIIKNLSTNNCSSGNNFNAITVSSPSTPISSNQNKMTLNALTSSTYSSSSIISANQSNHLLRILNSPPKPIVSSCEKMHKICSGELSDAFTSKSVINKTSNALPKNEKTISIDSVKKTISKQIPNTVNKNNLGNNLFIYKSKGKIIRLTPLVTQTTNTAATKIPSNIDQKHYLPIYHHENKQNVKKNETITSNAPPTLNLNTFMLNNSTFTLSKATTQQTNNNNTKIGDNHSVFEEIYANILKTKELQQKSNLIINNGNGINTIVGNSSGLMLSEVIDSNKLCDGVKSETGVNLSTNILLNNGKTTIKSPTIASTGSTFYLKQIPKNQQQTHAKANMCEITLISNDDEAKTFQPKNEIKSEPISASAFNANTNPLLNQVHITFPLITSNCRNISMPSFKASTSAVKANYIRPQVLITSPNDQIHRLIKYDKQNLVNRKLKTISVIQKIEQPAEHRNLVDQLREFDMVMERMKERNTNTIVENEMKNAIPSTVNDNENHERISNTLNGLNYFPKSATTTHATLPHKLNLSIVQKNSNNKTSTPQNTAFLTEKSESNIGSGRPVVVVSNNKTITNNLIISPCIEKNSFTINTPIISNSSSTVNVNSINLKSDTTLQLNRTFNAFAVENSTSNNNNNNSNNNNITNNLKSTTITQSQPSNVQPSKQLHKSQEDKQTVQRIYDILAQYAEQISSSPDLNNKPAPRRRSNLIPLQTSTSSNGHIKMISTKSSISNSSSSSSSPSSSVAVSVAFGSCSNSNSSEVSQGAKVIVPQTLAKKRQKSISSLTLDEIESNDANLNSIDMLNDFEAIRIPQQCPSPDKKRRLSDNNNTNEHDINDYLFTSLPSQKLHTNLPSNQIIITTKTAANTMNVVRHVKKEMDDVTNYLETDTNKLNTKTVASTSTSTVSHVEPLKIGIPNNSSMDIVTKTASQSTAAILLPGNYLLPMSLLKYGKRTDLFGSSNSKEMNIQSNRIIHIQKEQSNTNRPTFEKNSNIQYNATNKTVENSSASITLLPTTSTLLRTLISGTGVNINKNDDENNNDKITINNKSLNFMENQMKMNNCNGLAVSKNNFMAVTNDNILPKTYATIQQLDKLQNEQKNVTHISSQIFQSNHGILILDNKYATLLTTNCTLPTTTPPIKSETKTILDTKLSNINTGMLINAQINSNRDTITATTTTVDKTSTSTINLKSDLKRSNETRFFSHEKLFCINSPEMQNETKHDENKYNYLLDTITNMPQIQSKCDEDKTSATIIPMTFECANDCIDDSKNNIFDTQQKHSPASILSDDDLTKTTVDILDQDKSLSSLDVHIINMEHSDQELLINQMQYDNNENDHLYHNDKSNENIVIIDKLKSDSLTLNSVTRRNFVSNIRKNLIIERELRLQKSLSEECEDLGVDEPSTSDLFPEAFINF